MVTQPERLLPVVVLICRIVAKIYFDGGAKPNPGVMEVAVVIKDGTKITRYKENLKTIGTNNLAEWTALVWAAHLAYTNGHMDVEFIGDSQLIVNQALGSFKIKAPEFKPFKDEFTDISKYFDFFSISYVPRSENLAGVFLENG